MTPQHNSLTTVCAQLTGVGRSAFAVVQVCGPQAVETVRRSVTLNSPRMLVVGQIRYGYWTGLAGLVAPSPGESIVVTLVDSDTVEVYCHGGRAAIARILSDLQQMDVPQVDPCQLPSQWFPQAEFTAIDLLSRCTTQRMAAIALEQVRGAYATWVQRWQVELKSIDGDAARASVALAKLRDSAAQLCRDARWGSRLAEPLRVVLAGPPNVGKSTLVNQLLGWQRSITYDQAGTTRDVLHATTVLDGIPLVLMDTAGVRVTEDRIEGEGVRRSELAIGQADLLIAVCDAATFPLVTQWNAGLRVLNKADALTPAQQAAAASDTKLLQTVATTGLGIQQLQQQIISYLAALLPAPGAPVPLGPCQREQAFKLQNAHCLSEAMQTLLH